MTRAILPPKTEPLVDDDKFGTLNWTAFFEGLADGDTGTSWTPTFVSLTEVGTATKAGKYWRVTKNLAYFRITITPTTNTSAVAGTTYCDNFPLNITTAGVSFSISGTAAGTAGITSSPKAIYTSTWTAVTNPITITGIIEVS